MIVSSASALFSTVSAYSRCSQVQVGVEQECGHADDAVHRRADLVAHVGEELALRRVRRLGLQSKLVGALGRDAQLTVRRLRLVDGVPQGSPPTPDVR